VATSDKLYWLIKLLGSLEMGLQEAITEVVQNNEPIVIEPDWRSIQQRLMPEVLLVLGQEGERGKYTYYPSFVVVPDYSDYWRVTTDEELDALKAYLDELVPENSVENAMRLIASQVARIPEKNSKAKFQRLVGELTKMLESRV
jgi:hypothetical protein